MAEKETSEERDQLQSKLNSRETQTPAGKTNPEFRNLVDAGNNNRLAVELFIAGKVKSLEEASEMIEKNFDYHAACRQIGKAVERKVYDEAKAYIGKLKPAEPEKA